MPLDAKGLVWSPLGVRGMWGHRSERVEENFQGSRRSRGELRMLCVSGKGGKLRLGEKNVS